MNADLQPEPITGSSETDQTEDDRGASLVEYALLIALIALVCFAAITFLGQSASNHLSDAASSLAN
jgi:Flp pilus assembly pilin Flp